LNSRFPGKFGGKFEFLNSRLPGKFGGKFEFLDSRVPGKSGGKFELLDAAKLLSPVLGVCGHFGLLRGYKDDVFGLEKSTKHHKSNLFGQAALARLNKDKQ
jgi:hypothetical protein